MGLGSKELDGQILAGVYLRELYEVGDRISIDSVEGGIEEIGTVKTSLLTDDGLIVSLSNRTLIDKPVSR